MNSNTAEQILIALSGKLGLNFNPYNIKQVFADPSHYSTDNIDAFIEDLTEKGQNVGITMVPHLLPKKQAGPLFEHTEQPFIVFKKVQGSNDLIPVILFREDKKLFCLEISEIAKAEPKPYKISLISDLFEKTDELTSDSETGILTLSVFPIENIINRLGPSDQSTDKKPPTPMRRLLMLLGNEKQDIWYIVIYAVVVGIINLSLPLGIQAIIGLISGGLIFSSVVVLIALVIIGIVVGGGLQILQLSLVEIIRQRIFAKAAFEFAYRIPRFNTESLQKYYPPELINRFIDVLTVQKGLPKLFTDLLAAILQIFFGLMLLSFYHPFFIVFSFILIFLLVLIFWITGPKGLETSLIESKYKYKLLNWFQEMARNYLPFKLAGHSVLPIKKTDDFVNNYLLYRRKHFDVLLNQFGYIVAFKTLITGGLLILGTLLVVDRQITLGQFVASEIVIIITLAAVEKIILSMDVVYDLLTGVEKVGNVTDMELEKSSGLHVPICSEDRPLKVAVNNLSYTWKGSKKPVLKNISFEMQSGESICLSGLNGSGKATLVKVLSGLLPSFDGAITYNRLSIRDLEPTTLRSIIGDNATTDTLFDGTILDNITMGRAGISPSQVTEVLEAMGLSQRVAEMKEGLYTYGQSGDSRLSRTAQFKITLARAIVAKPKILFVGEYFSHFSKSEKKQLLQFLTDPRHNWIVIFVSNHPMVREHCSRILFMKEGQLQEEVGYSEGDF